MSPTVSPQAAAPPLTLEVLRLDPQTAVAEIESAIREIVFRRLKRRGVVVGLSGGIDSSTVAALCVRALGPGRVLGLMMPEADSSPESAELANLLAEFLGIETKMEDITAALEAVGCYRRRDEAIRELVPSYTPQHKCKIVLANVVAGSPYPVFSIVTESPEGEVMTRRMTSHAYLTVVAATNFKQRTRKMLEYFHADQRNYAVAGTPNRLEYDQGFFVKNGDGAADLKPIAHLYKSQVYQLAEYLGIPEAIRVRPPSTDTYSMEQSQEEFYFSLPYDRLDLCLWARENSIPASQLASAGFTEEEAARALRMIDAKRAATRYLHSPALSVADAALPL